MRNDDCELCRAGVGSDPAAVAEYLRRTGGIAPPSRHGKEIRAHLEKILGPVSLVFAERRRTGPVPVEIGVIPASGRRDFHVLFTTGMSDLPMRPPAEAGADLCWAELALCLPGSWRLDRASLQKGRWFWPLELLRIVALHPHERDAWIWYHHAFDFCGPVDRSVPFEAALLDGVGRLPEEVLTIPVAPGKEVNLIAVIPLFRREYRYWHDAGADALCFALRSAGVTELVDPGRKPVVR